MYGGIYLCDNCGYSMGHYGSDETNRIACLRCSGWMHLTADDMSADDRKFSHPNIIWLGMAHVIWFFLKPISKWIDKRSERYDDDDV